MSPQPARLWHVPQLSVILWSFTRNTPWLPKMRSRTDDLHLIARVILRGWVRLICDRRGPAGFIIRDNARIHALYVHPRARGRGLGRAMLEDAKGETACLDLYVAQANGPARQFYAMQGFTEESHGIGAGNDENLPDILMVWHAQQRATT